MTPAAADDQPTIVTEAAPQAASSPSYLENVREIIFYSLSMVGINYRWGGNSPQTGFDCSGLVRHVFRQIAGLVLPRDSYGMARLGQSVDMDDLKPGDLVFFNTMKRPFSHVGIYVGDKRFIHAPSRGKAVQLANMTDSYWVAHYSGARRINF
jgi:cell wall-associated NlpC family hydrolase